jgi:PAS domain S-box-containing protein
MQRIFDRILKPARRSPLTAIEALQQKTLNILLWGSGIASLLARLILLFLGNPGSPGLYIGIYLYMLGLITTLLMERYVSYTFAGLTFNILVIVAILLSDTELNLIQGESLIFFIFPIAIAGLLVRPWAGYVAAAVISLGVSFEVIRLGLGIPNIPIFLLFFMIALVIQQSTSRLQKAMEQEQKKSRELFESEEKYHRLIDLLPIGVLIHQDGKIIMANPASLKLVGARKSEEVVGTLLLDYVHPEYRSIVQERIRAASFDGKITEVSEEQFLRRDGSTFYADASGTPFLYNGRDATLVVFSDATDRRRIHEAIALQHLHIQEMSRKLLEVQEREKHLLSAELHDDLGQSLTSLKLMLELSNRSRSTINRQKKITEARELVVDLMNKVRNLSLDLRPAMLDDFGLFAALRWLYDRFESQTGITIQCNYDLNSQQRFESHLETAGFRIIQEALTNIARHAAVRQAEVSILTEGALKIEVADKGCGFDVDQALQNISNSAGLSGMQERGRLVGGSVEIISTPNSGTRVIANLPLEGSAQ